MLPFRQALRVGRVRLPAVSLAVRFNLSVPVPSPEKLDAKEVEPAESDPAEKSVRKQFKHPFNRKLRDITRQIGTAVAKGDPTGECIEMLEEGLSYLREIQTVEGISDELLYHRFSGVAFDLFKRAKDDGLIDQLLEVLVKYRVAHEYHFVNAMIAQLRTINGENALEVYTSILRLWVWKVEYHAVPGNKWPELAMMWNAGWKRYYGLNVAYFAYVMSCLKTNTPYSMDDAHKLLQYDKLLPAVNGVTLTLKDLGLRQTLHEDIAQFRASVEALNLQSMDPNGAFVVEKMNEAVRKRDVAALDRLYEQIKLVLAQRAVAVSENTMLALLNSYFNAYAFDGVFRVFSDVLALGVTQPSVGVWDVVLRSMGHNYRVQHWTTEKRREAVDQVEASVATLTQYHAMTPKLLAAVVGSLTNLGRFDLAQGYLERFSHVQLIDATKNNIIIGLLNTGDVAGAEAQFRAFEGFVPSTMVMNTFLDVYAKRKNFSAVEGILSFMRKHHVPESTATYGILINVYFLLSREKGQVPDVAQILASIFTDMRFFENVVLVTALIDGLIKDGTNVEAARLVYAYVRSKYPRLSKAPHLATTMIKGELDHGSVASAELLFNELISKNNVPRMWNMVINSLMYRHPDRAIDYFKKFQQQAEQHPRVKPNFFTYYFLLTHLSKKNNRTHVQWLLDQLAEEQLDDFGNELPSLVRALSKEYVVSDALLAKLK